MPKILPVAGDKLTKPHKRTGKPQIITVVHVYPSGSCLCEGEDYPKGLVIHNPANSNWDLVTEVTAEQPPLLYHKYEPVASYSLPVECIGYTLNPPPGVSTVRIKHKMGTEENLPLDFFNKNYTLAKGSPQTRQLINAVVDSCSLYVASGKVYLSVNLKFRDCNQAFQVTSEQIPLLFDALGITQLKDAVGKPLRVTRGALPNERILAVFNFLDHTKNVAVH